MIDDNKIEEAVKKQYEIDKLLPPDHLKPSQREHFINKILIKQVEKYIKEENPYNSIGDNAKLSAVCLAWRKYCDLTELESKKILYDGMPDGYTFYGIKLLKEAPSKMLENMYNQMYPKKSESETETTTKITTSNIILGIICLLEFVIIMNLIK
jgi:hypothetical protein